MLAANVLHHPANPVDRVPVTKPSTNLLEYVYLVCKEENKSSIYMFILFFAYQIYTF